MLDKRDYISRIINRLLESLNKILLNINPIEFSVKENEIEEVELFFKENFNVDLNDFSTVYFFLKNKHNEEYAEIFIKYYYIQHISNKNNYTDICLKIINLYKKKYMIFNFSINEIEIYFLKNI